MGLCCLGVSFQHGGAIVLISIQRLDGREQLSRSNTETFLIIITATVYVGGWG